MSFLPEYDFAGWATRNDVRCSDGRTIKQDAFVANDKTKVPLVWNHKHESSDNVLGYAFLENRPEGVYCYGSFNATTKGKEAKQMVEHGDITSLSIYANHLNERNGNVYGGSIKEVSLVMAGANPGAYIETVMSHSEDGTDDAIIFSGCEEIVLKHSEEKKNNEGGQKMTKEEMFSYLDDYFAHSEMANQKNDEGVENEMNKEEMFNYLDEYFAHAADLVEEASEDPEDFTEEMPIFDIGDDWQPGDIFEDEEGNSYIVDENGIIYDYDETDEGDEETMYHNLFDNQTNEGVLTHADEESIFANARQIGSLREAVEASGVIMHDDTSVRANPSESNPYGIISNTNGNITWDPSILFPDFKNLNDSPYLYRKNEGSWIEKVMSGVKHTPFSRIKSMWADLTPDEARAKGYVTGNRKIEEIFAVLKRTTVPTTIYKKQKLDRDDILDISDFDVVAWIKREMRLMLDEEIARAIITGDGRLATSVDHINDQNIRPILNEDPLFTIPVVIDHFGTQQVGDDGLESITDVDWAAAAKKLRKAIINAKKDYKGSGNLGLFVSPEMHAAIKLLEDGFGRPLYANDADICSAYNVNYIVEIPYLFSALSYAKKIGNDSFYSSPLGVVVDLNDYIVGADKGGQVSLFDDFDIDYNQQKYLIETRCCGALTKPHTAFAFWGRLNDAEDDLTAISAVIRNTAEDPVNTREV